MKFNPHLYSCKNYGYHTTRSASLGVNLTTKKVCVNTETSVMGEESYDKYVDECNVVFKSIYIDCDFWVRINQPYIIKHHTDIEFYACDYSLMELLTIISEINSVRGYRREDFENYLIDACINTIESRITSLQSVLCAVECRKFLVEETEFVWNNW